MKIPPRVVFTCQVVATIWACFVQIAVMNWTLGHIGEVCTLWVEFGLVGCIHMLIDFRNQASRFTCPNGRTFFFSSVVWGKRLVLQSCQNTLTVQALSGLRGCSPGECTLRLCGFGSLEPSSLFYSMF